MKQKKKQNDLMSRKHKKVCLNYIEHFLMLDSTIKVYISISAFASLIGTPVGIMSSALQIKLCLIAQVSN